MRMVVHKKDVTIKRGLLKDLLKLKKMKHKTLYETIVDRYGLDLSYKGFMALISNRSSWKLLYAWAICDVLGVELERLFEIVDIDVEQKKQEKLEWKEKYEKHKDQ